MIQDFFHMGQFNYVLATDGLDFELLVILYNRLQLDIIHTLPVVLNLKIHFAFLCIVTSSYLDTTPRGNL